MLYLYENYSWISFLVFFVLDLLPVSIRKCFLKIMLGSLGGGGFIDRQVYFRYPKRIHIGDGCKINRGCSFFGSVHTKDKKNIVIGDNVAIGPETFVFSAGHDPQTIELDDNYGRVTIENNVWIGGRVTILQGVTIHEGAVVGAGSVVVKDIPSYTICTGNPATVVKQRIIRN